MIFQVCRKLSLHLIAFLMLSWACFPAAAATATAKASSTKTSTKPKSSSSSSKTASTAKNKPSTPEQKASSESTDEDSDSSEDSSDEKPKKSASAAKKPAAPAEPTTTSVERLPSLLDSIVAAASKAAHWGVKITDPQTGQALYERNANEGFIPASNRKIFTGALALDQLGPDFRFRTFLYRTGNVAAGGALNGNLVIIPSGDPTFSRELYRSTSSDWVYRDWSAKVAESGIKNVSGDLLIDCSAWDLNDLTPQGWAARVLQDSYAPQTSPLTLNENLITVVVNPGAQGAPGSISFAPPATGYPVTNQTVTGKEGRVAVRRTSSGIVVSGTVTKAGQGGQIPCDNPTLFAAANFRHHLREKGVHVQGSVRIVSGKSGLPGWNNDNLIAMVESAPLLDIVKHMMKKSDNHMAEQIYVAVSAHKLGRGGYTASKKLEADLLRRAGVDPSAVHAYDGSGLSETNRVTPSQICSLLAYMLTHPQAQNFYDSMAIGGVDGTLRNRMGSEKLKNRVHAKTGTINSVSTLSGYFRLNDQKTLTFSFLVNNIRGGSVRGSQDRIVSILSTLAL